MTYLDDGYQGDRVPYWSDAYMEQQAEKKGCTVERADDSTLQLDIDSDADFDQVFLPQWRLLESLGIVATLSYDVRRSKSGNKHVRVRIAQDLPILERILLQAVLGSDRKRELLSYAGFIRGQKSPVVFFRPKGE